MLKVLGAYRGLGLEKLFQSHDLYKEAIKTLSYSVVCNLARKVFSKLLWEKSPLALLKGEFSYDFTAVLIPCGSKLSRLPKTILGLRYLDPNLKGQMNFGGELFKFNTHQGIIFNGKGCNDRLVVTVPTGKNIPHREREVIYVIGDKEGKLFFFKNATHLKELDGSTIEDLAANFSKFYGETLRFEYVGGNRLI